MHDWLWNIVSRLGRSAYRRYFEHYGLLPNLENLCIILWGIAVTLQVQHI